MYRLVLVVILAAYAVANLGPDYWAKRRDAGEKCRTNNTVTEDEFERFVTHRSNPNFTSWCFAACVGKIVGFITDKNTFGKDAFNIRLKEQDMTESNLTALRQKVINDCAEELKTPEPDACEMAHKTLNCTVLKSVGFLFVTPKP